jgi:hypothetical protein
VLEGFQEFDDGVTLQILSVFPGFVLQQIQNCLAVRQLVTTGQEQSELHWTYLGYADDTPAQLKARLKQLNLVGPAGFISMEDGAVGGFVQRGIKTWRRWSKWGAMAWLLAQGGRPRPRCAVFGRPIAPTWRARHDRPAGGVRLQCGLRACD